MKRLAALTAAALLITACGDDESDREPFLNPNATTNVSSNNTTMNNVIVNNVAENVVANNESTNNSVFEGYDAEGILALTSASIPAGKPCEATATIAFGENVVTSVDAYGYDDSGRLLFIDTFEDGTFVSREARRYDGDAIAESVIVDVEQNFTDLVQVFSYDSEGRPDTIELAVPDQSGMLSPALETVEYTFASAEAWDVDTVDDQGEPVGAESYAWDSGNNTLVEVDDTGAETTLTFASSPDLGNLYQIQVLEPFEYGAQIAGGQVDEDVDGTPESTITTTYDGDAIQSFVVASPGGGNISFEFAYSCP